jgi:hypothetical protein
MAFKFIKGANELVEKLAQLSYVAGRAHAELRDGEYPESVNEVMAAIESLQHDTVVYETAEDVPMEVIDKGIPIEDVNKKMFSISIAQNQRLLEMTGSTEYSYFSLGGVKYIANRLVMTDHVQGETLLKWWLSEKK